MKHSQISNLMFLLLLDLFSNKQVKQVVLINHSWIHPHPPLYKRDRDWTFVYSSKNGGEYIHFFQKKEEVVQIVEEWRLLREYNLYVYLLIFVFINLCFYIIYYIYIFIPVRTLLVYFRNRHLKIFLHVSSRCPLLNTDHILEKKVSLIVFRHRFYQNLVCGEHCQFINHDLFENVVWKLLFENCLFFCIFDCTYCDVFALKENHYSKQTNHFHDFRHEEIRMPH